MKQVIIVFIFLALTIFSWFAASIYQIPYPQQIYSTLLWLTIIHFFFKIILERAVIKTISDSKTRYEISKIVSILYVIVLILALIRIWIADPQVLLVSYGLVAAGITVALQDFFKNFMGGLIILVSGTYRVGDRIEVNSKFGDIIDIGILNTTLFELQEWVNADQPTGRITTVPNGFILNSHINNYTKDNPFIWDEIRLPITYDSDWKDANKRIMNIVREETRDLTIAAQEQRSELNKKYYLSDGMKGPAIYLTMTDNWIELNIRYLTYAGERRNLHDKLSRLILEDIQKDSRIKIASATMDITVTSAN
ncbi:mechanosensitive ion channel protein MscS [Methanolobus halotolerans]|uniref:Mechanosensitive ion channel protein MscS n=2 Tax=Methanolobus halotolerans TaxID=2052935 RepID=A0A4E0QSV4_9EURY|nr:mechanosensitive ion channel protein MscS [Methanolobus halotolerans]